MPEKPDVPQGTLTRMVLKTLDQLRPLHGYGRTRFYCLTMAGHNLFIVKGEDLS